MGPRYCTICGAKLSDGLRFCEQCGSPVIPGSAGTGKIILIIAAGILLVIVAAIIFFGLPVLSGTQEQQGLLPGPVTPTATIPIATTTVPEASVTATAPAQKPDPFPDALGLGDRVPFGSGSISSEATIYRYWINETYEWHNDKDNRYYVEKPGAGNKFLFVFVHMENKGNTRVWFPPAGNVIVYNNGVRYMEDRSHYKPDKASDEDATPVEVKEVQYYHKLNGDEYVEDFGFSHGTELGYLYPGASNAIDGYIIYEIPMSLAAEETYVLISFNAQDHGTWKLT